MCSECIILTSLESYVFLCISCLSVKRGQYSISEGIACLLILPKHSDAVVAHGVYEATRKR